MANCWINAPSGYARHLKPLLKATKKDDKKSDKKSDKKNGRKITS
jgi:hypothetical protein